MAIIPQNLTPEITEKYTVKNNTFLATPKDNPKDRIQLEVGDSKTPDKMLPQQKIMRWDNECNVSIRLKDFDNFTVETEGEKIKLVRPEKEVHFYQLGISEEHPEDAQEFEIILNEPPKTNVMEFSVVDKDVSYFYQPELTPEEIAEGAERPENVVGSYAVYAKTQKVNYVGGKEYKTGKVGHIYRPQIEDSAGNKVWGELHIENGILSVTIPQKFLDEATYPIHHASGLTFGYTGTQSSSSSQLTTTSAKAAIDSSMRYTASGGDVITGFSFYGKYNSGSGDIGMAAYTYYSPYPVSRLGTETTITLTAVAGWINSSSVSQSLTNGVVYCVAFGHSSATIIYYYDEAGSGNWHNLESTGGVALPTTWSSLGSGTRKLSIYATYTVIPKNLVANTSAVGTTETVTTGAINTTNANLIVIGVSYNTGATPTIQDSKSNSWTPLTAKAVASNGTSQLYYCISPTVGSGHTFSNIGAGNYCTIFVQAFSGMAISSTFDQQNGATNASASTLATGSVTPGFNNELVVTHFMYSVSGTTSIDSDYFKTDERNFGSGNNYGGAMACFLQVAGTATNPTWSETGGATGIAATIATFKSIVYNSPFPSFRQ